MGLGIGSLNFAHETDRSIRPNISYCLP
jgi:hypothetical protein